MAQQPEFSRYYQFPAMPIPPHWHQGRFAQWDERIADTSATLNPSASGLRPLLQHLRNTPRIQSLLASVLGLPSA
ncbi:MAG: hypothetical protein AB7P76_10395 [Candidatus Melainabacteria bacterium]